MCITIKNFKNGSIRYYKDKKLHREDGPAIITKFQKCWYINGKLHREDGPAHESSYMVSWYKKGKLHREDGPAIELLKSTILKNCYYLNGKSFLTEKDMKIELRKLKLKEILKK